MNAAAVSLVVALAALGATGGRGIALSSLVGGILVLVLPSRVPRAISVLAAATFFASATHDLIHGSATTVAQPSALVWMPAVLAGIFALWRLGRTHLIEGLVDGLLAVQAVVVLVTTRASAAAMPSSTIAMLGELTFIVAVWGRVAFTRRRLSPAGAALFAALALSAAGTALYVMAPDAPILPIGIMLGAARGLAVVGLLSPTLPRLLTPVTEHPRALPRTLVLLTVTALVGGDIAWRIAPENLLGVRSGVLVLLLTAALAARVVMALAGQRLAESELHERRSRDAASGLYTLNHIGSTFVDVEDRVYGHLLLLHVQDLRGTLRSLPTGPAAELTLSLAARIREAAPDDAILARGDEDELVVLHSSDADETADRVLAALRTPIELSSSGATVSVDLAAAVVALGDDVPFSLAFEQARYAAALAMTSGRRVVPYDGEVERGRARAAAIADALPEAIASGAITAHFQPIVEVRTGRVLGFETLARWTDATLGPVGPVEFIPLAEATGSITQLGRRLTEQACEQLGRWQHLPGQSELYISVNLSPRQLTDDLDDWLTSVIERTRITPRSLLLEITEGVLVAGGPGLDAPAVLDRVRALGVRIAIDDFGTGYSSLAYLQRFRPDVVKIDRSFTQRLATDDSDVASSIFGMLDGLGWDVVAEGIEDEATAQLLTALSCHAGQGWLWSAAVDGDRATDMLVMRDRYAVGEGLDGLQVITDTRAVSSQTDGRGSR